MDDEARVVVIRNDFLFSGRISHFLVQLPKSNVLGSRFRNVTAVPEPGMVGRNVPDIRQEVHPCS